MSKVIITAERCEFHHHSTHVARSHTLLQTPLHREVIEAKRPADVIEACKRVGRQVAESDDGSFFVSHRLERGERAFAGYRKIPHTVAEMDRSQVRAA